MSFFAKNDIPVKMKNGPNFMSVQKTTLFKSRHTDWGPKFLQLGTGPFLPKMAILAIFEVFEKWQK